MSASYLKLIGYHVGVGDSGEYDSESCELCQDRLTQGTLSGGSPIRRTRARTYSHSAKQRKDKTANMGFVHSEDEETTRPNVKNPIRLIPSGSSS